MHGLSMVTKGFITPFTDVPLGSGSGGAGLTRREEELPKPHILVTDVTIKADSKQSITEDTFKVKSLKIIVDQKD